MVQQGQFEKGLDRIGEGLAVARATGSDSFLPYSLGLCAEAHLKSGQATAGLEALDDAFAIARRTGERFWEAELHPLRGELQLAASLPSASGEAEKSFLQAIDVARSQGAKLLTLRAIVSLGQLWWRHGKGAEARQLITQARREIDAPQSPDLTDALAMFAESEG